MRLLIDSHAMLWWTGLVPARISRQFHDAMAAATYVAISTATCWEVEIKRNAGKLSLPPDLWERVEGLGIECLAITQIDAVKASQLPLIHRDPFDRMIIAQAIRYELALVTADAAIAQYDLPLVRI